MTAGTPWRIRASLTREDVPQRFRNRLLISQSMAGMALLLGSLPLSRAWRARWHFLAARLTQTPVVARALRASVAFYRSEAGGQWLRRSRFGLAHYDAGLTDRPLGVATSSLVLKPRVSAQEKGVVLCSFEYNWAHLLRTPDLARFLSGYILVGFSSWSPTNFAVTAAYSGLSEDPLMVGVSNACDHHAYGAFAPTMLPLELMASDWVNPDFYEPRPPDQRDIDILMVANFLPFKRHWLLFDALRRMNPSLRVVVAGERSPGRDAEAIFREARAFGVRQPLEVLSDLRPNLVPELQCRAKVVVLCSAREGANVASAESLFANTPIALMSDCHVGAKAYINSQTGILLRYGRMHEDLEALLARFSELTPRAWALANISCRRSSERLNEHLRRYCEGAGRPWTRGIAPFYCRAFTPFFLHQSDEEHAAPVADQLLRDFGLAFRSGSRV